MNKLLVKCIEIESQLKLLEEAKKEVREKIIAQFKKEKIDKLSDPILGSFTLSSKKTYEYSKKVKSIAEELKIAKIKEEQRGIATVKSETEYLVYTPVK
jgi:hypothetical protein